MLHVRKMRHIGHKRIRNEETNNTGGAPVAVASGSFARGRGGSHDHPSWRPNCQGSSSRKEETDSITPRSSRGDAADAQGKRDCSPQGQGWAMKQVIYFDTSALVKWYLPEEQSSEVEKYIQENGPVVISDLTVVEMRDLLARHRRDGSLDLNTEMKIFATFEEDIRQKFLICHPLSDGVATRCC